MSNIVKNERIAELRKQRGWDRYELAAAADLHPSVVTRLEKGEQADFKLSVLVKVAGALGVTVDSLLMVSTQSQTTSQEIIPALREAVAIVSARSAQEQEQVAAIIRGYLSSLGKPT